jgi:hypothetical protein
MRDEVRLARDGTTDKVKSKKAKAKVKRCNERGFHPQSRMKTRLSAVFTFAFCLFTFDFLKG